jgi:hypothetical protein
MDKIVTITKELFIKIFKNPNIPRDDKIRERSALFISYIFRQLIVYYLKISSDPLSFDELSSSSSKQYDQKLLAVVLPEFMHYLLEGLTFEEICVPVAVQFCLAMENYPSIFIKTFNMLPNYIKLLEVKNITVMTLAIKSLNRLFSMSEYNNLYFFFCYDTFSFVDEKGKLSKISINEILFQLTIEHNEGEFNEQILHLFIMIAQLNRKITFLTDDQRKKIYAEKIRMENDKVFEKVIEMMRQYEDNPLIAIIDTLNTIHAPNELVDGIVLHLHCIRKDILDSIDKVIIGTLNDNKKCFRACQVFLAYHKMCPTIVEKKMLLTVINLLYKSIDYEFVFGTFCDFLANMLETNFDKLISAAKRATELAYIIFQAFKSFEKPRVLGKIMKVVKVKCQIIFVRINCNFYFSFSATQDERIYILERSFPRLS